MSRSEGEMCDAFAAAASDRGWLVYPETSGWDLVLVWPEHVESEGTPHGGGREIRR